MAAVVVTVDAPPMNEFIVNGSSGLVFRPKGFRQIGNNMFDMMQVVRAFTRLSFGCELHSH
eukprot:SAG31_NODE_5473_length_2519_cov_1.478099_5_plen_61_part_00